MPCARFPAPAAAPGIIFKSLNCPPDGLPVGLAHGQFLPLLSGLLLGAVAPGAVQAQTRPISYAVAFKGQTLATQTVSIVEADGLTTVTAAFEIEMPVFIARHRYAETLSATFRSDGSAVRLAALRDDNSDRTEVRGELQDDGLLRVVRTDRSGVTTNSSRAKSTTSIP
jgi:hypothetical protein